jgi:hypothetical protein
MAVVAHNPVVVGFLVNGYEIAAHWYFAKKDRHVTGCPAAGRGGHRGQALQVLDEAVRPVRHDLYDLRDGRVRIVAESGQERGDRFRVASFGDRLAAVRQYRHQRWTGQRRWRLVQRHRTYVSVIMATSPVGRLVEDIGHSHMPRATSGISYESPGAAVQLIADIEATMPGATE